jgi:Mg2+ and Co2+ transporter CorA
MALRDRTNLEAKKVKIEEKIKDAIENHFAEETEKLSKELEQTEEELEKAQKILSALHDPKKEAHKAADKVGHAIKRALEQLMDKNEKAGIHFERALRRKKNLKKRMKSEMYESKISYDPAEDIKWHLG